MKKTVLICAAGAGIYLALGVYNLLAPAGPSESFAAIATATPEMKAAKQILGDKCIMCHSKDPILPFYAKVPLAGGLIKKHVKHGSRMMNLQALLDGTSPDPWAYDRIKHVIENSTMPITPYLLLHWNGNLTQEEQAALLAWIQQVKDPHR